uniref:Uncharacterized protein n=1 Tax=Sphingopyxis macrogoltabida TaxID=33050 RepID=A9ZM11_SPHMC|nr:hypothetical protein [Sphingopyxis macrogoltabida]
MVSRASHREHGYGGRNTERDTQRQWFPGNRDLFERRVDQFSGSLSDEGRGYFSSGHEGTRHARSAGGIRCV